MNTDERPTINAKPAGGVFVGACAVLGIAILNRNGVDVSAVEASAGTVVLTGIAMWLIPSTIRRKLDGDGE